MRILLMAVFALLLCGFAQEGLAETIPFPASCVHKFSGGSGWSALRWCLTANGNLLHFESPRQVEHVGLGEGYSLCSGGGATRHGASAGFDDPATETFGPPTTIQPEGPNTVPLTIIRTTNDGIWQLKQDFQSSLSGRSVTVVMTATNQSALSPAGVYLDRYMAMNLNGDYDGDQVMRLARSVIGWDEASHGVLMTRLSPDKRTFPGFQLVTEWHPDTGGTLPSYRRCHRRYPQAISDVWDANTMIGTGWVMRLSSYWPNQVLPGESVTTTIQYRAQ